MPISFPLSIFLPLLLLLFGVSACNTVEGAGRDIEEVGDVIQDAAD